MAKKEKELKNKKKGQYFKDMKAELKKVVWPTPKQLLNNTGAVIVFTLIVAVIVFVLDLCFDSINKYGVTPLQEKITSSYNNTNTAEENSTDENTSEANLSENNISKESSEDENSTEENSESSSSNVTVETESNSSEKK